MNYTREVPFAVLVDHGISTQEANIICGGSPTVPWNKVAQRDGYLALCVLTEDELGAITSVLVSDGLPEQMANARGVADCVWASALTQCPQGKWYDHTLVSTVAYAHLLRLVQQCNGVTEEEIKRRESEEFERLLSL